MTDRKRKKTSRYRGSKTHGCGSMKKRRGAGNRGGRGKAGSGYRGDAKKPSFWKIRVSGKDPAKKGFASRFSQETTINIGHLASIADMLLASGKALEQSGKIVVNLRELGYTKLLGAGSVSRKLSVGVALASPKAKAKIEAAGGSLDAEIADKSAVLAERAANKGKGAKKKAAPAEEPAEE